MIKEVLLAHLNRNGKVHLDIHCSTVKKGLSTHKTDISGLAIVNIVILLQKNAIFMEYRGY